MWEMAVERVQCTTGVAPMLEMLQLSPVSLRTNTEQGGHEGEPGPALLTT